MDTISYIKSMKYYECYNCGSCHLMSYRKDGDEYECEQCYRTLKFNEIDRLKLKLYY